MEKASFFRQDIRLHTPRMLQGNLAASLSKVQDLKCRASYVITHFEYWEPLTDIVGAEAEISLLKNSKSRVLV